MREHQGPYRSVAPSAAPKRRRSEALRDAELVVLLIAVSPVFLAVVVLTVLRGETFGAGPTICGGILVTSVAIAGFAWAEARRRARSLRASKGHRRTGGH